MHAVRRLIYLCLALLAPLSISLAVDISISRPGSREFVRDEAGLLRPEDKREILGLCDKLLAEKATPIIVITIKDMRSHGGDGMRIETFSRLLFDQWEIGHAQVNGAVWNTGILLLVSPGDRKARIELGAGWHRDKDQLTQQIMDEQIIPRFKAGDFSAGIAGGVIALDAMARERTLPAVVSHARISTHATTGGSIWPVVVFLALGLFTVISLTRRGSSGWAWLFWGAIFTCLGYLLYHMANSNRQNRGSSGGGFFDGSGTSFGGGFSGGGGSTGSW